MTDKPTENSDEDKVSLKSNGRTPTNGAVKLGRMKSFRKSFRRAVEKSPLSPTGKGSKVTPKTNTPGDDSGSQPPPSPSLSSGSPLPSPLKNVRGIFPKKEEADVPAQKRQLLKRSTTDPNIGATLLQRGAEIRRSLRFGGKKDKDKKDKQEPLVAKHIAEEKEEEKKEEEVVWEEVEEAYTLPEIPHTPLSVMEINKLIQMEVLEEAHLNLLALRQEFNQEREKSSEDSPMELAKKEKDLNILYGFLKDKISTIVRDSNSLPSRNKALLVHVARVIQEEERRAEEPGGLQSSWREVWREAVSEGVQAKVGKVHLEPREQNPSWLAVHLGLLGKAIVEDLEMVKKELRASYPPSFKVFGTYVKSYHRVVGQHLKKLERQVTEPKDLHALLNWIINGYKSEKIMGSQSLRPEMRDESTDLQLEDDFLKQLKDKYCCRVKEDMRSALDKLIEVENDEIWKESKAPEKEDGFLNSDIHMDIWTLVEGNTKNGQIDAQLQQKVISSCLEELKQFPKRFEVEFKRHCSARHFWTEYQLTYINSFSALQEHMEGYQDSCPNEVDGFRKEVNQLIERLLQDLENQFKKDVEPYLRRMMTRKWLTGDSDFQQLHDRTKLLSEHCSLMRPPHVQELVNRLHFHVVREYVGQLMKNNYSCKNRKHEKAAAKISAQCNKLQDVFIEMNSSHEWLRHVGEDLSNIIKQKNKADIKDELWPVVLHYPDFSKKHLVAVLNFRGLVRGRERQLILQKLTELKKGLDSDACKRSQVLFGDMPVTVNTDCFSRLPFSCFNFNTSTSR